MAPSLDFLSSSLLCAEEHDSIFYDDNDGHQNHVETQDHVLDVSDERLDLLIEKECQQFVGFVDYLNNIKNGKLDVAARQEAVDWITKVHAYFNFGPLTAYLAVNYLDRFLAVYELPAKSWMMQLLAVACLSLAAKMEETEIPLIHDLQVGGSRFVFESKSIKKMELLVLTTLKWRVQSVTPFSFIDDFLGKVNGGQPISKSWILTSTQLILGLFKGVEFLEFRPSEIAAAVASHVVGSTQLSALAQHVPKVMVLKCMELLKELNGDCTVSLMSGTLTSMPRSPTGVLEAACYSVVGSCPNSFKRRRLNNTPFNLEI
ncbi:cyclin-D4-1-like [Bidens hawaiensis]|uniref:cyclin-D4-1-like n=1 Tax=Bidens hawaiensis TaxID=980011 RepID=UPI00404B7E0D